MTAYPLSADPTGWPDDIADSPWRRHLASRGLGVGTDRQTVSLAGFVAADTATLDALRATYTVTSGRHGYLAVMWLVDAIVLTDLGVKAISVATTHGRRPHPDFASTVAVSVALADLGAGQRIFGDAWWTNGLTRLGTAAAEGRSPDEVARVADVVVAARGGELFDLIPTTTRLYDEARADGIDPVVYASVACALGEHADTDAVVALIED